MKTGGESHVEGFRQERLKLAREQRMEKREAAYKARKAKWAAEAVEKRAAFEAAHPEFCAKLAAATDSFALDLQSKLAGWGSLSDAQIAAVERGWARDAQRAAEKAASAHMGVVGKRLTGKFEIVTYTEREGFHYNTRNYWYLLKLDGNVCTYSGSVHLGQRGEKFEATFTVKEHGEYKGTKQTKLARPKFPELPDSTEVARERAEDAELPPR